MNGETKSIDRHLEAKVRRQRRKCHISIVHLPREFGGCVNLDGLVNGG